VGNALWVVPWIVVVIGLVVVLRPSPVERHRRYVRQQMQADQSSDARGGDRRNNAAP
jgi:hypothetical protein